MYLSIYLSIYSAVVIMKVLCLSMNMIFLYQCQCVMMAHAQNASNRYYIPKHVHIHASPDKSLACLDPQVGP